MLWKAHWMDEMDGSMLKISFQLNGKEVSIEVNSEDSALMVLRDRLRLKGTKEGCGIGECGACTILVDGLAVNSCLMLAAQLDGRKIQTVEGLMQHEKMDVLQKKFIEHGAIQCGFCSPGMLLSARALLDENPSPDHDSIVEALSGNLCRCTGYVQAIEAVEAAAEERESR
jgi:carbon-monoxide dehydrogenase small subunit